MVLLLLLLVLLLLLLLLLLLFPPTLKNALLMFLHRFTNLLRLLTSPVSSTGIHGSISNHSVSSESV
jgi:hypothetical protein